jgi:hypothetical protein
MTVLLRVTAIQLSTRVRHPEYNEGSLKVALCQFQEILHCVQDDVINGSAAAQLRDVEDGLFPKNIDEKNF